jgi:glycosyltransferase involved in cell wall biosynthesis
MISIIVPTLNAAPALGPALAALAEGLREGVVRELILADGGSTDDTAEIAEAVGAQLLAGPPERAARLAAGAAVARGGWLMFVEADAPLAPDWPAAARAHIAAAPEAAGWFPLRAGPGGPALGAALANFSARLLARPAPAQGLLIARPLYDHVGGHGGGALIRRLGRRRLRALASVAAAPRAG